MSETTVYKAMDAVNDEGVTVPHAKIQDVRPPRKQWDLLRVKEYDALGNNCLRQYLDDGWEPYAVNFHQTRGRDIYIHHFKREKVE